MRITDATMLLLRILFLMKKQTSGKEVEMAVWPGKNIPLRNRCIHEEKKMVPATNSFLFNVGDYGWFLLSNIFLYFCT
jgi:hypothetical protein